MTELTIKSAADALWDCVSLGEVMLRLDPGETRVRTARSFRVWEGGGEYNVTRALRKVFHLHTAVVTSLVDNEVGHLVEDLMMTGGVDTRHVQWVAFDGFGHAARVGLNFTEKGYGIRPAQGTYDRGHTAIAALKPGDVDWQRIFSEEGARWLHTGGIFAALSEHAPEVLLEAVKAAKATGTVVSYDLNYRASLWKMQGGQNRAIEINRELAPHFDVMIGNEYQFGQALGLHVPSREEGQSALDPSTFKRMIDEVMATFPNLAVVATTQREETTANVNDLGAVLYADGDFHVATPRMGLEIYDRVGGGDGFASGMIYALLDGRHPGEAVEYGAAHGALCMTTPGDTSMMALEDVQRAIGAKSVRALR